MKTLAPELSALIIILRSVGPVISTRRSFRSAGAGATCQSALRIAAVSGKKAGNFAGVEAFLSFFARSQQFDAARVELTVQHCHKGKRVRCEHFSHCRRNRANDFHAGHRRLGHRFTPMVLQVGLRKQSEVASGTITTTCFVGIQILWQPTHWMDVFTRCTNSAIS
jgi:hypothetical protein